MEAKPLSPATFEFVLGACKGSGKSLGEIAALARTFEAELNAWLDDVDATERTEVFGNGI